MVALSVHHPADMAAWVFAIFAIAHTLTGDVLSHAVSATCQETMAWNWLQAFRRPCWLLWGSSRTKDLCHRNDMHQAAHTAGTVHCTSSSSGGLCKSRRIGRPLVAERVLETCQVLVLQMSGRVEGWAVRASLAGAVVENGICRSESVRLI